MSGFLDKETRIVDMVLTAEGRRLLSRGGLSFVYWMPFDDEVDYDPFISTSGSMAPMQLSSSRTEQIEFTLVREAVSGYGMGNRSGSDETNVQKPLFTIPQGQQILPRMIFEPTGSQVVSIKQRKLVEARRKKSLAKGSSEMVGPFDRGFERFDASTVRFSGKYTTDAYPDDHMFEGFLVRVFKSGTFGVEELTQRIDSDGEPALENQLKILVSKD